VKGRRGAPLPAPAKRARAVNLAEHRPIRHPKHNGTLLVPNYDFDAGNRFTGQFYEQATGRGIIAWRGDVVQTEEGKKPRLLATLGDIHELGNYYKPNDWNEPHIIARGHQFTHILNRHVVAILFDDDKTKFHESGKIGLEVEATGKLWVRDIWLKKL
jgi:hypothetical protein